MAFYGNYFSFDGQPCTEYGLMVYDLDGNSQSDNSFTSSGTVVEDRVSHRYKPLYYGIINDKPLEFNLIFGANPKRIEEYKYFDRWDLESIASWLTGKDGYKWLEIEQPDMEAVRYKCIISDLKPITMGRLPYAFSCKVICDSPFAYTYPETTTYSVPSSLSTTYFNRSSYNGYYRPKLEITLNGVSAFKIKNITDNNREFTFTGLPTASALTIYVDNENGVITNSLNLSTLYNSFNFNFFRLKRGENSLLFTGTSTVKIISEFPVNIGG